MTPAVTAARTVPSTSSDVRVCTGFDVSIARSVESGAGALAVADAAWPCRLRRLVRAKVRHWGLPTLSGSAELLATELLTNALRYGKGPAIGVRLFLTAASLFIEIADGSTDVPIPRSASSDEEGGRGLLLVNAIAESWGVSPDGTTTWCSLPLPKGPDMDPVTVTGLVLREHVFELPGNRSALHLARVEARSRLTILGWRGNVHVAVEALGQLVDNAVRHGLPQGDSPELRIRGCLSITSSHQLVLDIEDRNPRFANFAAAREGAYGRGLWRAKRLGAEITWFPLIRADAVGKVVRAVLTPGPVEP